MSGWTARLRVRVTKTISSDENALEFDFDGQKCTLRGQNESKPLKDQYWWILSCHNFDNQNAAEQFGQRLSRALRVFSLRKNEGIDVGLDRATLQLSSEIVEKFAQNGHRWLPNVHGLSVYERSGSEVFLAMEASGVVWQQPESVISGLENAQEENLDWDERLAAAIDLVVLSKMAREPLAEAALAISAVEHLAQETPWSTGQTALLEALKKTASENEDLPEHEKLEVIKAIELTFKSVRQSIRNKLKNLGFDAHDLREFDRIYGLRSGIVHGTILNPDLHPELAQSAQAFCTRIILAAIEQSATSPGSQSRPIY